MSNKEILQAVELHAESELKEWVTAVVKLEVNEDGGADVHFEAFQMSDMCIRLFKEGWFDTEIGDDFDPKLSKMKKDVVVGVKDRREIDNDFFLVGPLSTEFPIENRNTPVTMRALRNHLDPKKNLPFLKRISDFHMLLLVARFVDVNADVPALAQCVQTDSCTRRLPAPNRVHGQYLLICLLGVAHSMSQYVTLIFWEDVDLDLVAQL